MQADIVNTFERKMNPKLLPKHSKVRLLGVPSGVQSTAVGILELQEGA